MTGVFNVKKLAIWHTVAPTYGATTVIIMDMLPWTAQIRYHHLAHWHATGLTPMTGMIDPPLNVIATPDVHTMITRIDPGSVVFSPAPLTIDIGVAAARTPIEATPGHFTDLPATILTIPLIYPQYNLLIHLSNIAMHFHNSHPTVSSLNMIYIPAYYSHSPLP